MLTNLDYFSCPLPEDVARLVAAGDYARAEKVIALRMASPKVPQMVKERLGLELRMIEVLPSCYPYTEEEMFALLKEKVRDITLDEMNALRDDGTLDWIYRDGKVYYKSDAYDSLIKTRVDMNERFIDKEELAKKYENFRMLDEAIADMKKNGGSHYRFRLKTTLSINPKAQRPGEMIRVHMTLPLQGGQSTPGEIITSPAAKHIAAVDHPQRTAYFEEVYQPGMTFTSEFTYDIRAPYADPKPEEVSAEQPDFDTGEALPQIQFTPFIKALVKELVGEETNPLVKARRFYDYITTQCCYRYVPPYFTKTNIPEYFGIGQRGDCGMHALLFITLCRCAGIPAQWQAGLYTRPGSVGCHDWARFYIVPYGWLYCDASFGGAAYREGHLERWNFFFANLEPFRMVANSDIQQDFDPPFPFLRADPYDNQDGEVCYADRGLRRGEFQVKREMLSWEKIV
ncbi:MAG: transglutaminase-like domain-containing protein [Christensenellales bacterium]